MTKKDPSLDRPFAPAVLKRAREIVQHYRIVLEHDESGEWVGGTIEIPTAFGGGKTPAECVRDTFDAVVGVVAHMLEQGQLPPESSSRTEQVNIRLTAEEKFALSAAARRIGFKGLSDFIRSAALDRAGCV